MPHGHCYLWKPELVWLHVTSDSLIFLSYITIPATLVYFVRKRTDLPFDWIFQCFGVFIVSCGLTHLMEVWTLWHPSYWLSGAIKVITALASMCTSALLMLSVPKALAIPSPSDLKRAAAALEASETRFRAAAEGMRDEFYILDAIHDAAGRVCDFSYVYTNSHARTRLDRQTELIGKRISEVHPQIQLREFIARCSGVMESGRPLDEEVFVKPPVVRTEAWLHMQIVPLGAGVAVTSRDITARKHAEEALKRAEERFRGLLEAAPDAMVIVDSTGKIELVNAQAERMFGYLRAELIGQSADRLVPERYRFDKAGGPAPPPTMAAPIDVHGLRKDGSEFPAEISLSPIETPAGTLITAAVRDISERNRLEEQRHRSLEEANRLKSEFVANMSHELRTPLNAIMGFAKLMHAGRVGAVSDEQREYLGDILTSSNHLLQLINDVLDLSKVEAGRMEFFPEPIDLPQLIGEVRDTVRAMAAAKQIKLEVEVADDCIGLELDRAKLKQLLYNYVSNALKFTSECGRVRICARLEDAQHVRFAVEDTGVGIRPDDVSKLFVEFRQLDASAAKKHQGTGLGLALTKRIVEAQAGWVGVESAWGQGSTFFAVLPRVTEAST